MPACSSRNDMPDTHSIAETVQIRVSAFGLGFHVSRRTHDLATRIANETGTVCFVGVQSDGAEIVGTDRDDLSERGCEMIAWITPDRGVRQ